MDPKRPFSSSTLTTNEGHSRPRSFVEGHSRPRSFVDRQGSRTSLPRRLSRRCSVLEDMYKNPQQYAGILEDPSNQRRGVMKQVLLLAPMFSSEFCRTFSFVFMLVNLKVLGVNIGQSVYCSLAAGAVCIFSIYGFRWLHKRLYYSKKFKITAIICYNAFLVMGLALVLRGNAEQHSSNHYSANGTHQLSDLQQKPVSTLVVLGNLDNNSNVSSEVTLPIPEIDLLEGVVVGRRTSQTHVYGQNETHSNNGSHALVSFDATVMVSVGYVMTTSSLVGGHYILQSLFLSMSHSEDRSCVISIIAVASTTGTCAMGISGAVNVSISWLPNTQNSAPFFRTVTTLASLTIGLILLSTMCSVVSTTWPWDVSKFSFRRRSSRHSSQGAMQQTERRSTRTAQEIYDECAPLLRKLERARERRGSLQEHEDNELSQSESVHAGDSTESAQSEIVARYSAPAQLPSTSKETLARRLARRRHFFFAALLVFLTSIAWLTMEFYSSFYLLHAVYYRKGVSNAVSLAPRVASIGALLMSISQLPTYILCRTVFPRIGVWKKMALGMTLLAFSSTLGLALSSTPVAYFVAMFFVGPVRVLVMGLPLLLTSHQGRSQIHTEASAIAMSFLTIPTTLLLSTIPASYMVTSLLSSTLTQVTNRTEIAVYFSATSAVLASCCFYILM